MSAININYPSSNMSISDICSYLYQLAETLNNTLNNIDDENLNGTYRESIQNMLNLRDQTQTLADMLNKGEIAGSEAVKTAVDELKQQIVDSAETVTTACSTLVEQTDESIRTFAQETYAAKSELGTLEEDLSSQISQTAQAVRVEFAEADTINSEAIDNLQEGVGEVAPDQTLGELQTVIKTYFSFTQDGLEIGKSTDPVIVRLTNDKLSFILKDSTPEVEIAYIDAATGKLNIASGTFSNLTTGLPGHQRCEQGADAQGNPFIDFYDENNVKSMELTKQGINLFDYTGSKITTIASTTQNMTIHIGVGQAYTTIQAAFDAIPMMVNHAITLYIHAGTYDEIASLWGKDGGGYIHIRRYSTDVVNIKCLYIDSCSKTLTIDVWGSMNITATDRVACRAYRSSVGFNGLSITGSASLNTGIYFFESTGNISSCTVSNKDVAIDIENNSNVLVDGNAGVNNNTGIAVSNSIIYEGNSINTITGTTPRVTAYCGGSEADDIGEIKVFASRFGISPRYQLADGGAISRATYPLCFNKIVPLLGNPTISIANPGSFTLAGHGLLEGDKVYLTTTGALPTGLSQNTIYYVRYLGVDMFYLATSLGGAYINTSGTQSGVHSIRACPHGLGNGSSTFNKPNLCGKSVIGYDPNDTDFRNVGATGGEKAHKNLSTESGVPPHHHTIPKYNYTVGTASSNIAAHYMNVETDNTGDNVAQDAANAHNNLHPYGVEAVYIKVL